MFPSAYAKHSCSFYMLGLCHNNLGREKRISDNDLLTLLSFWPFERRFGSPGCSILDKIPTMAEKKRERENDRW